MARMLLSFLVTLLMGVYSHPAGLECGTDASTRLRVGQKIMKSTVTDAAADSPVKVLVQGSIVTVTSQAGIHFAIKAFGEGATISIDPAEGPEGSKELSLTKDCSNQAYTMTGTPETYTFTHNKAESIVVGYASKPGVVSLVTAKVSKMDALIV